MTLRRSLCLSIASLVLSSVFAAPYRLANCLASESSEIPPELRRVVIRDKTTAVLDGKRKVADATWGECYGVSQQQDGWLLVQSKDGVAKRRFVRGWIKRESVVPEAAAQELFLTAQRERPNDPLPSFCLALAAIKKKDTDRALRFADEAVRLAPGAPLPRVARSEALTLKDDFDRARAECEAALKIDPDSAAAYYCLGRVLSKQKLRKEAIDAVNHAQERDPSDPAIARFLATLFWEQEDFAKSKQAIDSAIRLDPTCGAYYYTRSVLAAKAFDFEAAFDDVAIAERLDPNDADNKIWHSMLFEATGDMRAAYREAICGFDSEPGLHDRPRRLIHTLQRDEPEAALTRLKAWALQSPQSSKKYVQCATAYEMCGKWDDAIALLRPALELDANHLQALLDLAMLLKFKGEHDQAVRAIAASRQLQSSKQPVPWQLFEPAATNSDGPQSNTTSSDVLARFEQGSDAHFLFISLTIDGKTVRLMLDTGAPITVLNNDLRAMLGPSRTHRGRLTIKGFGQLVDIPIGPKNGGTETLNLPLQGGRKVAATAHRPRHLKIGSMPVEIDVQLELLCARDNSVCTLSDAYGIAGLDVLRKAILQLDPSLGALRFLPRLPADPGIAIPLTASAGAPHQPKPRILTGVEVPVQFSGGQSESIRLDTGCRDPIVLRSELYQQLESAGAIQSLESEQAALASKARASRDG
jgi:superkiller protein 3